MLYCLHDIQPSSRHHHSDSRVVVVSLDEQTPDAALSLRAGRRVGDGRVIRCTACHIVASVEEDAGAGVGAVKIGVASAVGGVRQAAGIIASGVEKAFEVLADRLGTLDDGTTDRGGVGPCEERVILSTIGERRVAKVDTLETPSGDDLKSYERRS